METGRSVIPSDAVLAKMTRKQINDLANSFTVDPRSSAKELMQAQNKLEWLSDALLRINNGFGQKSGAYSEEPRTSRNRRICGHEIAFSQVDNPEWVSTSISDAVIKRLIGKARRARCTRLQQIVWVLSEAGYNQDDIAIVLDVNQPAVSRALRRARLAIWDHIDKDAWRVFFMESHRMSSLGYCDPNTPEEESAEHQAAKINLVRHDPGSRDTWRCNWWETISPVSA